MKNILVRIAAFIAIIVITCQFSPCSAQWSWEGQVRSEYLGKVGINFYDKPIFVNDIGYSHGDYFAGIWSSTGIAGQSYGSTFADEIDLYAGWAHSFEWVKVKAVGQYFGIKNLDYFKNDIWVAESEVLFTKVPIVQPYVSVRYFGQISSESPNDGWFAWAGLRRSQDLGIKFKGSSLVMPLDLMTAYSDGALGRDPGFVFVRLTAAVPFVFSKGFSVTPSILYQLPIGNQRSTAHPYNRESEVVGAISAKFVF